MSEEATTPEPEKKRRGPRKEADIRAEVEAEMRAKIEAEVRREYEEREREAARERELAAEARPISGSEVDGDPTIEGSITVHFVEDGLTLLGKVWFRGEELTINPGTENWDEAYPVLSLDEFAQEERWGKRFFREGVWRGKRLDEIDWDELTDAEREQLRKAEQLRQERYGKVVTT